jgi:ubiquinone/menaquinone biosynthesis C-methylase UbiE
VDLIGLVEKVYYRFHRRRQVVEFLRDRLGCPRAVLDFGGGTGRVSTSLAARMTASFVVADVDATALRRVPRGPRLHAVRIAHQTCLPFSDGSFDRMIVVDTLHHVEDAVGALQELVRCLQAGGSISVVELDARRVVTRLFGLLVRLGRRRCRFWPPGELAEAMRGLGLRTEIAPLDSLRYCVSGRE